MVKNTLEVDKTSTKRHQLVSKTKIVCLNELNLNDTTYKHRNEPPDNETKSCNSTQL